MGNGQRTTHHRTAELNIKIKYTSRLKNYSVNSLTNGGPPPYLQANRDDRLRVGQLNLYVRNLPFATCNLIFITNYKNFSKK